MKTALIAAGANGIGAAGLAWLVWMSGHPGLGKGAVAAQTMAIAAAKTSLPFAEAFFRGVLCNLLVCMAVWLAIGARSVTDAVYNQHEFSAEKRAALEQWEAELRRIVP